MLYNNSKKQTEKALAFKRNANQPYIGVIETNMMYTSGDLKEYLISVFTLFVEEPTRHLILVRFYEDFVEFDKRIKTYSRKFKNPLPKLHKEDYHNRSVTAQKKKRSSSTSSIQSPNSFKKLLYTLSSGSFQKSNSDNLERYLYHCSNDSNVQNCSLFREFLQPQRQEDSVVLKEMVEEYVSSLIIDSVKQQKRPRQLRVINCIPSIASNNDNIITPSTIISEEDIDDESAIKSSFLSYTSYHQHEKRLSSQQENFKPNRHNTTSTSTTSSSSIDTPVTIQDFQLIRVIGRGCMGKVLLVKQRNSSKLLALKAISKRAVIEQSQIVHVKAEQQILSDIASIHHPFLIKLHYSFQDMNQLFLVLDYHVGGDLATQLRINHKLPPERCRFYTAEIILGIQELHRLGILYRDLKPENILLTADGHVVLTDFGLSKQFYDGLSVDDQRTETFCGTAEYLAPEILNGQPYSYEVDYWSLGTILFEILAGITPFWAENRDDMYRRIRSDPLQFPSNIDIKAANFISKLLKREPSKRLGYGSNGALQIRSDPYYQSVNWKHVFEKRVRPPYIPNLRSETDFSYFDSEFLRMTPRLSPVASDCRLSQSLDYAFEGYSYTNKDVVLDSPQSDLNSLNDPRPPLMESNENYAAGNSSERGTKYYVYDSSEDVIPYDEYADDSNDDIKSIDFVRGTTVPRRFSDDSNEDLDHFIHQLPTRPTTRRQLPPSSSLNNSINSSNIIDITPTTATYSLVNY